MKTTTSNYFKNRISAPKSRSGDVVGLFKPFKRPVSLVKGEVTNV